MRRGGGLRVRGPLFDLTPLGWSRGQQEDHQHGRFLREGYLATSASPPGGRGLAHRPRGPLVVEPMVEDVPHPNPPPFRGREWKRRKRSWQTADRHQSASAQPRFASCAAYRPMAPAWSARQRAGRSRSLCCRSLRRRCVRDARWRGGSAAARGRNRTGSGW